MDFLKFLVWLASIGLALWTLYQGMRREGGVQDLCRCWMCSRVSPPAQGDR